MEITRKQVLSFVPVRIIFQDEYINCTCSFAKTVAHCKNKHINDTNENSVDMLQILESCETM